MSKTKDAVIERLNDEARPHIIFSKRLAISEEAVAWLNNLGWCVNPLNIVTALTDLGYITDY